MVGIIVDWFNISLNAASILKFPLILFSGSEHNLKRFDGNLFKLSGDLILFA